MSNITATDTSSDLDDAIDQLPEEELAAIKKKSVGGVFSFFLRTLLVQGIGLGSALILSAYFLPEDFGIFGFVIQIIGILNFFSDVGLAAALIQKKEKPSLVDYRTAFTAQQALSWFIVVVIIGIIATGIVQDKAGMSGVWILISLGLSFPLATLQTISRIKLERNLDFSKLVAPQILEQIVFHGLLIVLAVQGVGAIAYAYAIIFRSLIGAISMFWLAPWEIGLSFNIASFKKLIGYGAKFQINDFLARIKDQLFFLILGLWFPLDQFGFINWAKNWSTYPYNLTVQNVMAITFPTFSRLQGHRGALKRAIEKSLFFISLLIFPVLIGMSVFVFPLVSLVPKYAKWEPALFSLVLFSLSIAWGAISTPLTNTLNAIGHINTTLKLMVMWTVLTWVVTPACIYFFGFNGVALGAFIISFSSILSVYYVKKVIDFDAWSQIWQPLVASLVMGIVSWSLTTVWSSSFVMLSLGLVVAMAIYVLTLLLLAKDKCLAEFRSVLAYHRK